MALVESLPPWLTVLNSGLTILIIIILKCFYQIIYNRYFHPLRHFPGPFWGSVTRLWVAYHNLYSTEVESEYALHKKYGPVLRVTPTMLLVSDARKLPAIYHRKADKSNFYVTGSFGEEEAVLNMKSYKTHAIFRKMMAGPYSFTNIKKMEYLIDARMDHWISTMTRRFAKTNETFDFAPWAVYMAYDIISELGFGAPLGFVDAGKDVHGLIQGFHDGNPLFGIMARMHPFTTMAKKTWLGKKYLVSRPGDQTGIGVLMKTRDRLIAQRLEDIDRGETKTRVDLLQTFLDARTEEGNPLEMEYIKAEILLVLLAGADTTGTAFQAMVHYIFGAPEAHRRIMEEIDDADRKGLLSRMPQYDEIAANCPFYIASIHEAMRLCPSAPNIFPRVVSEPGLDLNGKFAPSGTEITCNPWLTGRDKTLYGEDAEVYRPDRWLENEQAARDFHKYNFAFGYGTRICLGRDVALMELYKGPLQFFRRFNAMFVDNSKRGRFVVEGGVGFWEDMQMTISERTLKR